MRAAPTTVLIFACALPAQGPAKAPEMVCIDQVIATVGDAAILRSTLDNTAGGAIRGRETVLGRPLTENELAQERSAALETLIDQHCLAQAAKTLGLLPPSRVEEFIREEVMRAEQEQVRQLGGSYQRFTQELHQQGKTWQAFEREERLERMKNLTEEIAVWGRLQNQRSLFITPQGMRNFYREYRTKLFVYGPRSTLGTVAFMPGNDAERAMARAREAAEVWRRESVSSAELATRFPGARALPDEAGIGSDQKQALKPFLRDFALNNPAGTVSEPIAEGGTIWLLKVVERQEGRNAAFEDANVQSEIRRMMENQVIHRLRTEAIQRSRLRTHIWVAR